MNKLTFKSAWIDCEKKMSLPTEISLKKNEFADMGDIEPDENGSDDQKKAHRILKEIESKEEELFRLIIESNGVQERMKTLLTEGVRVVNEEQED